MLLPITARTVKTFLYVDRQINGIIPAPPKVSRTLDVKLAAVVGALGIVTVKPVSDPPVDVVTEAHQAGVPEALLAKNIILPRELLFSPLKVIPVPSPVKANQ